MNAGSALVVGFSLAGLAVVFAVVLVVLGLGAHAWANAIAAVHRARSHGIAADEQDRAAQATDEALADVSNARAQRRAAPDEQDVMAAILAEREMGSTNGKYHSTPENDGMLEAEPPITGGGYYRQ